MLEGAVDAGCDITRLLINAGLSDALLNEPKSRITTQKFGDLSRSLIAEMQDVTMGLLDKPMKVDSFKVLTYYLLHSTNLMEAFRAYVEYMNLFDNSFQHEFHEAHDRYVYRLNRMPDSMVENSFVVEYFLVTLHRICCWLSGKRIPIEKVELDYETPTYHEEYRHLFLGAPVFFEQNTCSMSFQAKHLDVLCRQDLEALKQLLRDAPISLLTQTLTSNDIPSTIRHWMENELLSKGLSPDLNDASRYLNMNSQTLRRRLKAEGTSYHEIKQQVRRDAAINLLNNDASRIEDIAYQVGFSEPSTFIRAFKGWTGLTPLAYKKSLLPVVNVGVAIGE